MCGLVGFYDPNNRLDIKQKETLISSMLFVDSLRGVDNTGMVLATADKHQVHKTTQSGTSRLVQGWARQHVFSNNSDVFMGHNRWGTVGGINSQTTHPFKTERLIGMHNGTLSFGWRGLVEKVYQTDSESLYHMIDNKGLKEVVETIPGAMALVWLDTHRNSLNFYRNADRPLVFAEGEDGIMYWASEKRFINFATETADVKVKNFKELATETHFYIDLNTKKSVVKGGFKRAELPKKKVWPSSTGGTGTNITNVSTGLTRKTSGTPEKKVLRGVKGGNAIKFCNSVLKQMGSDKTHGSEVLFSPKFPLKHRAKRGVCGNHAWYWDDSVKDCGDDFEIIIPKLSRTLAEELLSSRFLVKGKIQSANKHGQVYLQHTNLELVNVSGDTFEKMFQGKLRRLAKMKDYYVHFKTKPDGASPTDNVLSLPFKKVCNCCRANISDAETYYVWYNEGGEGIEVHNHCLDKYTKNWSLDISNFTLVH